MILSWLITAIILCFAYLILMAVIIIGWHSIKSNNTTSHNDISVSVLIAFRNEANSLPDLLDDLAKQDYPEKYIEVILVNDHSDDQGPGIIQNYQLQYPSIKLIDCPTHLSGKKQALRHGLSACNGNIIILTDADCRLPSGWIRNMLIPFKDQSCILNQGPVVLKPANSPLAKLQQIEFLSLMMSAAGSISAGQAVIASGANLAVRKNFYEKAVKQLKDHIPTGDDMFLLEQAKKVKDSNIRFCKSTEAIVSTPAINKASRFWNQRKRWSSKSINYQDPAIIFTSILVLLLNLSILVGLLLSAFKGLQLYYPLGLWLIKTISELPLIYNGCQFYKIPTRIFWFFPAQVLYPFYVVFIAVQGVLSPYNWKERQK